MNKFRFYAGFINISGSKLVKKTKSLALHLQISSVSAFLTPCKYPNPNNCKTHAGRVQKPQPNLRSFLHLEPNGPKNRNHKPEIPTTPLMLRIAILAYLQALNTPKASKRPAEQHIFFAPRLNYQNPFFVSYFTHLILYLCGSYKKQVFVGSGKPPPKKNIGPSCACCG